MCNEKIINDKKCNHHHHDEGDHKHCGVGCDHHEHDSGNHCNSKHHHEHDEIGGCCGHEHHNDKRAITLYFVGLVSFLVAYILESRFLLVSNILYTSVVITAGYHVIVEGVLDTINDTKKAKRFRPNVHLLMALAAFGAIIIGNYEEAGMLILIFAGAHFLEEYVDAKSRKEIKNLLELTPQKARLLLEDNSIKIVPVEELKVGDKIQVLNGDQVPTDGIIIKGKTSLNEASINGESIPKEKGVGDEVFASTMNGEASFVMEVTKNSEDTVFAKILSLVTSSQKSLTKTASLLKRLEPKYVTIVLLLYPVVVLVGRYVLLWDWSETMYRSMVYLIGVSPCALAASAIPTTLATISNLSKRGVLVKGGAYLSTLATTKAICFDKTGTLTEGRVVVTDYIVSDDILNVVVSMESKSNHPLAVAVVKKFANVNIVDIEVENKVGVGVEGTYLENHYQIAKPGAFSNVSTEFSKKEKELAQEGKTVVLVAKNGEVVGLIAFMDKPKEDAKEAVDYFKKQGLHTTMITGDSHLTGMAVANIVKVDEVKANVLPEDKANIIKEQKEKYGTTMMVGDGVNDAPALALADVGVAMGEGTDVAVDVAEIVLAKNSLQKLAYTHKLSKKMLKVTYQNIIFAMIVVISLVTLNFVGRMDITLGVILHEGSTILVILNALRLLREIK